MGVGVGLSGWLRRPVQKPTLDTMLAFFITTLDVRVRGLEVRTDLSPSQTTVLNEVRAGVTQFEPTFKAVGHQNDNSAWNEAYRLERLLVFAEPASSLIDEVRRGVATAVEEDPVLGAQLGIAANAIILASQSGDPPTVSVNGEIALRATLVDIEENVHWASQRKFYSRPIQREATYRLVIVGLVVFFAFLAPYIFVHIQLYHGLGQQVSRWTWLPLYTSLTAGLFGAVFSRLLFLQQNWGLLTVGGLRDARDFTSILLRGSVGMTGAVIISFFLQSNIIAGGLFPKFDQVGFEEGFYPVPSPVVLNQPPSSDSTAPAATKVATPPPEASKEPNAKSLSNGPKKASDQISSPKAPESNGSPQKWSGVQPLKLVYPSPSLALLIVWSFLAGFSERLVPTILRDTETSISRASAPK